VVEITSEPKDPVNIKDIIVLAKPLFLIKTADFENLQNLLDQTCSKIAQSFNLYAPNGKPRKATIIDAIAESTCLACIAKKLSTQTTAKDVDALYKECHTLAVNALIEELCNLLTEMGYKVLVSTEVQLEYGKADVIITVTKSGINLKCNAHELVVEVKTGASLSLSQLFRYLLDERSNTIVVWRVRRRQVLVFSTQKIKLLLMEFVRIVCLRGARLLLSPQPLQCQHALQSNYQPTSEKLEKMFEDFADALVETLPNALEIIIDKLGVKKISEHRI